jgi:hypothetical protein
MLMAPKSNRPWGGGSGMRRQDATDTEVELILETATWTNSEVRSDVYLLSGRQRKATAGK